MTRFSVVLAFLAVADVFFPSLVYAVDFTNRDLNLPRCNDRNAVNINSQAALSRINQTKGNLICVSGKSYKTTLNISRSGTKKKPLIFRFGGTTLRNLKVTGNHVIIEGIHVDRAREKGAAKILGNNIVVTNSLFERANSHLIAIAGANVTVKDSVFRDTIPEPRKDHHCILVIQGANGLRIKNNQIYDCAGDGIQIMNNTRTAASNPANVVIERNRFFLNRDMYVGRGLACAENALDFKAGRNVRVANNTMRGFRPADTRCAGTGSRGGYAVVVHRRANNYVIEKNRISDSTGCIHVIQGKGHNTHHISTRNNTCQTVK